VPGLIFTVKPSWTILQEGFAILSKNWV